MDLLQDNKKKPNKTPAQKIVLTLLIISIVLCVIIGIAIAFLSIQGESKAFSISIDGKNVDLAQFPVISSDSGIRYISLKSLSNQLSYHYYNGEYKVVEESTAKGYIDNTVNITQFFADSNEIYKTTEKSNTDYEYYQLNNKIISLEGNLYIALDDLDVALNLIVNHNATDNQTIIQSSEYWAKQKAEAFKKSNITISNTSENLKALSYGYAVISKDNKYGVITLTGEELIGNKYNSITFCEYTGKFIVSNTNNEFGIITSSGMADVNLQYDSVEIINYKPLLYKVKRLNKYGVMKEDGNVLNDVQYDSIGYPENKSEKTNYTLIIPKLNENIPQSIVVCNSNKYGLLNLETGREVVPCNLDGIYSVTKDEQIYYLVETQNNKMFLESYINKLNSVTVSID